MRAAAVVLLAAVVVLARFSQLDILWVEEAYPLAAAREVLRGSILYRDIWFDKQPLYALVYLLWGAEPGWPLRLAGALYIGLCGWLAYKLAADTWDTREGCVAACLTALYLTFGFPSATMALAPDLLSVAPQLAAVWLSTKRRPFWAGVTAAAAFLFNAKALFVPVVCGLFLPSAGLPLLAAGFATPVMLFAATLFAGGAWPHYVEQVWRWGALYSRDTFVSNPWAEGVRRTANWAGFHAAAVIGALWFAWRSREWRWIVWTVLAAAAVVAGLRFFPRYYFMLLPVVVIMGARGLALMPRRTAAAVLLLVLIPVVRFGPRYIRLLAGDRTWSDIAMNRDAQQASHIVRETAGRDLLVWGYRPDIFVYSGLPAASRFLDSQPLTGVIADRHLTEATASAPELAARHRAELAGRPPTVIVDGLGPYNPLLAITRYFALDGYRIAGRTAGCVIYERLPPGPDRLTLLEKR